ncbi:unnamed protein product [Amoebophrya sp. A25]|nr:unnamed protein product [Amoebophrya sp. A25]|eukprot:GSA25T00002898001.1
MWWASKWDAPPAGSSEESVPASPAAVWLKASQEGDLFNKISEEAQRTTAFAKQDVLAKQVTAAIPRISETWNLAVSIVEHYERSKGKDARGSSLQERIGKSATALPAVDFPDGIHQKQCEEVYNSQDFWTEFGAQHGDPAAMASSQKGGTTTFSAELATFLFEAKKVTRIKDCYGEEEQAAIRSQPEAPLLSVLFDSFLRSKSRQSKAKSGEGGDSDDGDPSNALRLSPEMKRFCQRLTAVSALKSAIEEGRRKGDLVALRLIGWHLVSRVFADKNQRLGHTPAQVQVSALDFALQPRYLEGWSGTDANSRSYSPRLVNDDKPLENVDEIMSTKFLAEAPMGRSFVGYLQTDATSKERPLPERVVASFFDSVKKFGDAEHFGNRLSAVIDAGAWFKDAAPAECACQLLLAVNKWNRLGPNFVPDRKKYIGFYETRAGKDISAVYKLETCKIEAAKRPPASQVSGTSVDMLKQAGLDITGTMAEADVRNLFVFFYDHRHNVGADWPNPLDGVGIATFGQKTDKARWAQSLARLREFRTAGSHVFVILEKGAAKNMGITHDTKNEDKNEHHQLKEKLWKYSADIQEEAEKRNYFSSLMQQLKAVEKYLIKWYRDQVLLAGVASRLYPAAKQSRERYLNREAWNPFTPDPLDTDQPETCVGPALKGDGVVFLTSQAERNFRQNQENLVVGKWQLESPESQQSALKRKSDHPDPELREAPEFLQSETMYKITEPKEQLIAVLLFHSMTRSAVLTVRGENIPIPAQFGRVVEKSTPFKALRMARMQMLLRWFLWEQQLKNWATQMEKLETQFLGLEKIRAWQKMQNAGGEWWNAVALDMDGVAITLKRFAKDAMRFHNGWWLFLRSETLRKMAKDVALLRQEHLRKYTSAIAKDAADAKKKPLLPKEVRYQRASNLQDLKLEDEAGTGKAEVWEQKDFEYISAYAKKKEDAGVLILRVESGGDAPTDSQEAEMEQEAEQEQEQEEELEEELEEDRQDLAYIIPDKVVLYESAKAWGAFDPQASDSGAKGASYFGSKHFCEGMKEVKHFSGLQQPDDEKALLTEVLSSMITKKQKLLTGGSDGANKADPGVTGIADDNTPFVHGDTFITEDAARGYKWETPGHKGPMESPTLFQPFAGYKSAVPFHHYVVIDAAKLQQSDSEVDPACEKVLKSLKLNGRYMVVYVSVAEAGRFAHTLEHDSTLNGRARTDGEAAEKDFKPLFLLDSGGSLIAPASSKWVHPFRPNPHAYAGATLSDSGPSKQAVLLARDLGPVLVQGNFLRGDLRSFEVAAVVFKHLEFFVLYGAIMKLTGRETESTTSSGDAAAPPVEGGPADGAAAGAVGAGGAGGAGDAKLVAAEASGGAAAAAPDGGGGGLAQEDVTGTETPADHPAGVADDAAGDLAPPAGGDFGAGDAAGVGAGGAAAEPPGPLQQGGAEAANAGSFLTTSAGGAAGPPTRRAPRQGGADGQAQESAASEERTATEELMVTDYCQPVINSYVQFLTGVDTETGMLQPPDAERVKAATLYTNPMEKIFQYLIGGIDESDAMLSRLGVLYPDDTTALSQGSTGDVFSARLRLLGQIAYELEDSGQTASPARQLAPPSENAEEDAGITAHTTLTKYLTITHGFDEARWGHSVCFGPKPQAEAPAANGGDATPLTEKEAALLIKERAGEMFRDISFYKKAMKQVEKLSYTNPPPAEAKNKGKTLEEELMDQLAEKQEARLRLQAAEEAEAMTLQALSDGGGAGDDTKAAGDIKLTEIVQDEDERPEGSEDADDKLLEISTIAEVAAADARKNFVKEGRRVPNAKATGAAGPSSSSCC